MIIQNEVIIFLLSCLLGCFFCFYYDCFRVFRKYIPHHGIIVFLEDIFYFATSSIILFSFIVDKSAGGIRGFIIVGVVLGFILYFFTISIVFMKIIEFLFLIIKKVFNFILILFIPFKLLFRIFHYFYTKSHMLLCGIVRKCKKNLLKSNLT